MQVSFGADMLGLSRQSSSAGATRDGRCVERAGTWVSLSQSKLFPALCKHAMCRDCGFPRLGVPFL